MRSMDRVFDEGFQLWQAEVHLGRPEKHVGPEKTVRAHGQAIVEGSVHFEQIVPGDDGRHERFLQDLGQVGVGGLRLRAGEPQ
jgi:hypothetical protein